MPPIRNSAVARGATTAAGWSTIYTVPANTVFLLKNAMVFNNTPTTQNPIIGVVDPVSTAAIYIETQSAPTQTAVIWNGWIALNAGDQVQLRCDAAQLNYWLSGALLPYVPGF